MEILNCHISNDLFFLFQPCETKFAYPSQQLYLHNQIKLTICISPQLALYQVCISQILMRNIKTQLNRFLRYFLVLLKFVCNQEVLYIKLLDMLILIMLETLIKRRFFTQYIFNISDCIIVEKLLSSPQLYYPLLRLSI